MPVPSVITDLSTTAASNSPSGSDSPSVIDDHIRAHGAFIAQLRTGSVAHTDLSATGNVTLGDASTDTVTVNGYMGVGGAAASNVSAYAKSTALTGTGQVGFQSQITGSSAATAGIHGFFSYPATAAATYTNALMTGFYAANPVKGAGSTITDLHGLYIADQTQGTNNYGITSLVSSGANKWNIYASGTAANYFAGNVAIGGTAASFALQVNATNGAATLSSDNTSTRRAAVTFLRGDGSGTYGRITTVGDASNGVAAMTFDVGAGTERMRIDSSGNVGVGVTPSTRFHVGNTAASCTSTFSSTSGSVFQVWSASTGINQLQYGGAVGAYFSLYDAQNSVERMRIDSSGVVGVGVTPSASTGIGASAVEIGASGNLLVGNSSIFSVIQNAYYNSGYKYGSTASASRISLAGNLLTLYTAPSGTAGNALTWTTSLSVGYNGTLALEGATSATGTGIAFPATQNASSNANTLDDYEEGTFTPTIEGTSTAGTGTYSVQVGRYTKIGNRVNFSATITWSAHTGTGNMVVGALPFTSANVANNAPAVAVTASNLTYSGQLAANVSNNSVQVSLATFATGGALTALPIDTAATIYVAGHYEV